MTAAQRNVAAALVFLASAAVAGIALVPEGVEYRAFGMVEGVFALLFAYLLVFRGAWARPEGATGWIALAYGTIASAQALELLLPPPGMIEWMVVAALAVSSWGAFSGGTRRRLVFSLATLALLLAVIKFSVIPVLWARMGPAAGTAFGLGDAAEAVRRTFADYRPLRPIGQLVGFVALALWAAGTRLLWPDDGAVVEEDGRTLVRGEADLARLQPVDRDEVRGYLEGPSRTAATPGKRKIE
ncbi:MAG TPA: hypothetical protein VF006_03400 [Longimicrobium sp.]